MPQLDVVLLTEARYEAPENPDRYSRNILTEDGLVAAALERVGLSSARVDWARPDFDWSGTRAALFRSTWDYFFRLAEFLEWFERVRRRTRLINAAELVRWNLDKHYLLDLHERGVGIVPTRIREAGDAVSLPRWLAESGWRE